MPLINMRSNCCLPPLWHSMSCSHVGKIKIIEKWERNVKSEMPSWSLLLSCTPGFIRDHQCNRLLRSQYPLWLASPPRSSVQQAPPKPISALAGESSLSSSSCHASLSHIVNAMSLVTGLPHDTRIWPQGLHERGQQSWREGQCWHNFTINLQCCLFVKFGWC